MCPIFFPLLRKETPINWHTDVIICYKNKRNWPKDVENSETIPMHTLFCEALEPRWLTIALLPLLRDNRRNRSHYFQDIWGARAASSSKEMPLLWRWRPAGLTISVCVSLCNYMQVNFAFVPVIRVIYHSNSSLTLTLFLFNNN